MKLKFRNLLILVLLQVITFSAFCGIIITDVTSVRLVTDFMNCQDSTYTTSMAVLTQDCNSCNRKSYSLQFTSLNSNYPAGINLEGICNSNNGLDWKTYRASATDPIYSITPPASFNGGNNNGFPLYGIYSPNGTLVAVIEIIESEFGELQIIDHNGNNIIVTEKTCQSISCQTATIKASVALDQGQLVNGEWLMNDNLRTTGRIPLFDPYKSSALVGSFAPINDSSVATTTTQVLNVTGHDAIVDWVFLELRTGESGVTSVVSTRAALLQRDGDVVDVDGYSPVVFSNVSADFYYITIRHRNHLGFRTSEQYFLRGSSDVDRLPKYNFTDNSIPLYGFYPVREISPDIYAMNGGDANSDGGPDAFDTMIYFDSFSSGVYDIAADYNMDGVVNALDEALWNITNGFFEDLN